MKRFIFENGRDRVCSADDAVERLITEHGPGQITTAEEKDPTFGNVKVVYGPVTAGAQVAFGLTEISR